MKKIIVKKRHSIRKSQAEDLLSRLTLQIGPSAALFHTDMIEILETNAAVALYMVNKKPLLMDTGRLGLSHAQRGAPDSRSPSGWSRSMPGQSRTWSMAQT